MRIAFMGTSDFAVPALSGLLDAGHDVICVYSQPPRPAGRGQRKKISPVQRTAEERSIAVRHPDSLKDEDVIADFYALETDVTVVAAYGLLLPKSILDAPLLGCLNIHASLLPRWRGAAPIQRAILAGDSETGITIMRMDEGLDTGPIIALEIVPIADHDTASSLQDLLATVGGRLLTQVLADGIPAPVPQAKEGITYAAKLARSDGRIDWTDDAMSIGRRVRALNPWPGVWCERDGERLRVLEATPVAGMGMPGEVIEGETLTIACAGSALRIDRIQRAGRAAMGTSEYLHGNPINKTTVFS